MQQLLMRFTCVLFTYCLALHTKGVGVAKTAGQQIVAVTPPASVRSCIKFTDSVQQQDFWRTVRGELRWPIPQHPLVQEQLHYYLHDTYHFNQVVSRAEPYLGWIAAQIRQHHLPMELLLLPMVESAFDPQASSNKQAAGLWQITAKTGQHYGLIQNNWYDGRHDVMHSTTAALKLLGYLKQRFEGDWLLILAAYNSGETRVARAIRAQKAEKKGPIDYWSLDLPRETKVHGAKLLAISAILKRADQYGLNLPIIDQNKMLTCVDAAQPLALSQAAKMAGLSLATLKVFNPGYQQLTTSPSGPHHLMLPRDCVVSFKQALVLYNHQTSQSKRYTRAVVPATTHVPKDF